MSIGILGQKVGMTRVYDEAGTITPVTVILAEPNAVLQVKTQDNDGYGAVQPLLTGDFYGQFLTHRYELLLLLLFL